MLPRIKGLPAVKPVSSYRIEIPRCSLHVKQNRFVETQAKRKIIRAGRRWGKTYAAARIALEAFLKACRVLYVSHTSEQTGKFWRIINRALIEPINGGLFERKDLPHRNIQLPRGVIDRTGSTQAILCRTAWNIDMLRGEGNIDVLILDEWQLINEDMWGQVGVPMLLDEDGDAVFIYTPPSLHSRSTSKTNDPLHASRMYAEAVEEMAAAAKDGRKSKWFAMHGTSHDNPTLSKAALAEISEDMTVLAYRQEIMAEDTDEAPGAMWTRALLDKCRVKTAPIERLRAAVGVDPPGGVTECGIVGAFTAKCLCKGKDKEEVHAFVVEDNSKKCLPNEWGQIVVDTYDRLDADRIIGEENYGGPMVESTIKTIDPTVSYKAVHASRGKAVRAEPVSALYEQGKIHHVGELDLLEDEQCGWAPGMAKSPNRLDALVWTLTYLMLEKQKRVLKWVL